MDAKGFPLSYDVAVVGSGIVGLGAAYAAAKRGQRVVVIDRTERIVGATIRNFGHICIGMQAGAARHYGDISRELWLQLASDAGFWIRESGTLVAARHDDEMALLAALEGREVNLLDRDALTDAAPVQRAGIVGGARVRGDLQTNPREAGEAVMGLLRWMGVEFQMRTAVTAIECGSVSTTRGVIEAEHVVVAVNHDIDQLLPEVAEAHAVVRCALDMIAARVPFRLDAPLLTGWSLIRYARFAERPEAQRVRDRLHGERPELAAIDLNQMYTQLPDGTLLIGDSHERHGAPSPFQSERTQELLLAECESLFGVAPRVIERWQGVYASGKNEFLSEQIIPGVLVLAATTGIGMTCGLGLAEEHVGALIDGRPALTLEGKR